MSIKHLVGREKRRQRVRAKIFGTADRPRLSVFRSAKHIYAQLIDDIKGKTLVWANDSEVRTAGKDSKISKLNLSLAVGEQLAKKAKAKKVTRVVFDRGGYQYKGRVKGLADGARKGGLQF